MAESVLKMMREEALKRSAAQDARRISVEGGQTKLWQPSLFAEKQEAECAVWSAPGIQTVQNYISIAL